VFTSQACCFCAWIPFICLWKFWRTVKAEIFAGFVACLPLSELIRCRLKTQSRHQERKSSMAYFRGGRSVRHSTPPTLESQPMRAGLEERVCVREKGEEVVEWQSLLVCRERSISHAAAVCEHPQEWESLFILFHSCVPSFILYSILSSCPSPFLFLCCCWLFFVQVGMYLQARVCVCVCVCVCVFYCV